MENNTGCYKKQFRMSPISKWGAFMIIFAIFYTFKISFLLNVNDYILAGFAYSLQAIRVLLEMTILET